MPTVSMRAINIDSCRGLVLTATGGNGRCSKCGHGSTVDDRSLTVDLTRRHVRLCVQRDGRLAVKHCHAGPVAALADIG